MKKLFIFLLIVSSIVSELNAKSIQDLKQEINLEMCRSAEHRFSFEAANCTYCANGTKYNPQTFKCDGHPNPYGKCLIDDHYYAAKLECVYCAKGYHFDEMSRHCVEKVEKK
jgi:hypothetical protein